jgi:hypothetical protein
MHVIGHLGIVFALLVTARLSKQLGLSTHAKPYYRGFYVAAALLVIGAAAQLLRDTLLRDRARDLGLILLADGVPALALTIGVAVAWRYWSWLLAERD